MKDAPSIRLSLFLLAALCLFLPARADEAQESREKLCRDFLCESLNYSPQEAAAFTCTQACSGETWTVKLTDEIQTAYVFSLSDDGLIRSFSSPYDLSADVPGEGALRGLLRSVAWVVPSNLTGTASDWLGPEADEIEWENFSMEQTLHALFTLAFSDVPHWSPAVHAWYEQLSGGTVFASGARPEKETVNLDGDQYTLWNMGTELPEPFSDLELPGTLLSGAIREQVSSPGYAYGLVIVEQEEDRRLYMLLRQGRDTGFRLLPLPARSLPSAGASSVFCLRRQAGFCLATDLGHRKYSLFQIMPNLQEGSDCLCEIQGYTRLDLGLLWGISAVRTASGSRIRTWKSDRNTVSDAPELIWLSFLDFVDASAMPVTREGLAAGSRVPATEHMVYLTGAHLFDGPSAHAKDLGFLQCGTCASVLETSGSGSSTFLHVQAGPMDGWVQCLYAVGTASGQGSISALFQHPLSTGIVRDTVTLYTSTGLFASGDQLLDPGTHFRVLSRRGQDLLIAISSSPDLLLPAGDRSIGWIPASSAILAPSFAQAEALWNKE